MTVPCADHAGSSDRARGAHDRYRGAGRHHGDPRVDSARLGRRRFHHELPDYAVHRLYSPDADHGQRGIDHEL